MMHLWNLFEVPAVEVGEVHSRRMRFGFEVPNEDLSHLGIGGVANMSRSSNLNLSVAAPSSDSADDGLFPAVNSPAPLRRGPSIGLSTDRLLAEEDNLSVPLPSKALAGSPHRFPTAADTSAHSRTFAGNFPSIYESASARAARLAAERHHAAGDVHEYHPHAAPGSNSRAFSTNQASIYESLAARTARLALAREEAAQNGRESPPTAPPARSSGTSSSSRYPQAQTQPVMRRVRSNSEGSNIWRTNSEVEYSTSGGERRELNTLGYNRNSYNVFGNLEDE